MTKSKRQKLKKKAKKQEAESLLTENQKEDHYVKALLEEAEAEVDSFNYDEAELKLNEALIKTPTNSKALEMLAGVKIEKGEWVEAQCLLKKCIELMPDKGFSKYFSMGQLSEGEESLNYYQKGIEIILKELENSENMEPSENKKDKRSLSRILSDAYCSVAEIFMTDCCDVENGEMKCSDAVECALKADSTNPEAYQCLCNFKLSVDQVDEAKEAIEKCLSLWLPQHEALRDGEIDEEDNIPSYDCRIKISQLLIELELYDEATKVLDGLIEEDDEVVQVWYLLGWMNYIQGDEYKLNAHYYLIKAKKVSIKTGMEDVDYVAHIHELLDELKSIVPLDEEDDEENDWASCSDSENEMET
ncbi:uncharacterized protein [Parasteatoda tepidariorum]|uniref:uncharacterized protein isoform X2 n=1 Tax=Parasteatoda tepidariorum TaxID=114398 RepID=UPI00077F999B|nr:probable assembly chaperone of rpl4 isoform X2 [Parasteatoda tepidariorum]